mgnify:CR=1 FL=1
MINKRIATAVATGALLLNSFAAPAFAATNITLSGNGSESNNTANVNMTKANTIVQNNTANVTNKVDVDANTGNNDANDNTGGDVKIKTGDSAVGVAVKNMLNRNSAAVDCCENGDSSVKISGNGTESDNDVDLDMDNSNELFQDNDAHVKNDVKVDAKTGKNDADDNTNGDVEIETGDADVSVGILTFANSNFGRIGGGNGGNGGALSLWVNGNGSDSDSYIDADIEKSNTVTQDNAAHIYNDTDVDAETGDNGANDNTGGEVSIETGDAEVNALVANVGNFNWADLSCDCLFDDVTAKIADNGSESDGDIDLDLSGNSEAFQNNYAGLNNDLSDLEAGTGENDAEDNTVGYGEDPSINTGDADVEAEVVNEFNSNGAGIGGDIEFDFDWDEMFGSIFG